MVFLSVGQRRREWQGFPEGYIMSYDDQDGMTLFFFLDSPPEDVLAEVRTGKRFEIALADIEKTGFFTLRFGTLPFGDCAFAPCLFHPGRPLPRPAPGEGLPLRVVVIDAGTGELVYLRHIQLGYEFSVKLSNWFQNRMAAGISEADYRRIVHETYSRWNTEQLRELARISWRMEPNP